MSSLFAPRRLEIENLEHRVLFSASLASEPAPGGDGSETASEPFQESTPPASDATNQEGQPPSQKENGTSETGGSGDVVNELDQEQLEEAAAAAAELWRQSGLDEDQLERLSNIVYSVENFQGTILGAAEGDQILIDKDAAGSGWFVDATPLENEEFAIGSHEYHLVGQSGGAASATDLLSVLLHEQGHILGLQHLGPEFAGVMNDTITAGERNLPLPGEAFGSSPFFSDDIGYADAGSGLVLDPPDFPSEVDIGETIFIQGTFQNTAGNPVTVALLDENGNTIDSVDISPPDTSYALSAPATEAGTQKFTISLFDPVFPDTFFDNVEIEVVVKGEEASNPPPKKSSTEDGSSNEVDDTPVDPDREDSDEVSPEIPPPLPLSANGLLSYALLNSESPFDSSAQTIDILIFGEDDTVLGFSELTLTGDFNPVASVAFLNQLAINFEPQGLTRIEVRHNNGQTTYDYIAGIFFEVDAEEETEVEENDQIPVSVG